MCWNQEVKLLDVGDVFLSTNPDCKYMVSLGAEISCKIGKHESQLEMLQMKRSCLDHTTPTIVPSSRGGFALPVKNGAKIIAEVSSQEGAVLAPGHAGLESQFPTTYKYGNAQNVLPPPNLVLHLFTPWLQPLVHAHRTF